MHKQNRETHRALRSQDEIARLSDAKVMCLFLSLKIYDQEGNKNKKCMWLEDINLGSLNRYRYLVYRCSQVKLFATKRTL